MTIAVKAGYGVICGETCLDDSYAICCMWQVYVMKRTLFGCLHVCHATCAELQIRGSYEDNSKIIFLIFQRKHML